MQESKNEKETDQPFRELIGRLQYLALISRPDIFVAVNLLSSFQDKPSDEHYGCLKRILRYLQGTKDLRLIYRKCDDTKLKGFADADFANNLEDRKSVSGYVFRLFGNTVSWCTKKQQTVSLSSTEAELISLNVAAKEGIWISNLLSEIGVYVEPFVIYEDNIPCIKVAEEPRNHQRMKHIDIKYMYIRELVKNGRVRIEYLDTGNQTADIMTKPLARILFVKHRSKLSLN